MAGENLMQEGLSNIKFYVILVVKFRRIVNNTDFSKQFKKDFQSSQKDYNMTVIWQIACTGFKQSRGW